MDLEDQVEGAAVPGHMAAAGTAMKGPAAGRRRHRSSIAVFLLLLAGCSGTGSGESAVRDTAVNVTATTAADPTRAAGSAEPSVSRPAPIDLAHVDICRLVGELPLRDYGLDGDRAPVGGDSGLFPGSQDCYAGGIRKNLGLAITAVVTEGASSFVDRANAEPTRTQAAGYPLVVLKPRNPSHCFGVVDVHDGQMLYVSYGLGSPIEQPATPQDRLCRAVPTIAGAAISLLTG